VEERVGRYLFRSRIGSGSGGTVYLALEPDLERWVAVKQLAPELASDAGSLQRFREEAQTMARLNHPNCVRVFDFFEQDGNSYLVSEFVDGASLREVLQEAKELTPQQALGVLKGALMGLGHAHSLGLVHRDIKPENLLCDRQGTSKLADFGLATFKDSLPQQGLSQGSPLYMSPEQVKGEPVDQRADIYGCGCVLFELLTGRPPFVAENALAVMRMQAAEPVPNPGQLNRGLSTGVGQVVMKAMAKEPADRHQTAEEFLAALEEVARRDYGIAWENAASIAGPIAAAIAAGAASATAAASAGTPAAVVSTQAAVVATQVAAAAQAAAPPGGPPPGTSPAPSAARKIVQQLIRPPVLAVVAAGAVVVGAGAAVVASNPQLLGSTKPTSQAGGVSPAPTPTPKPSPSPAPLPIACDVLTLDLAQSVLGSDARFDSSRASHTSHCHYLNQTSQITLDLGSWNKRTAAGTMRPVPDLGDEAYESYESNDSALGKRTTADLLVRKGAHFVLVILWDYPASNESEATRRAQAAAAAKVVAKKLLAKL
jgi:hypothetical protein